MLWLGSYYVLQPAAVSCIARVKDSHLRRKTILGDIVVPNRL